MPTVEIINTGSELLAGTTLNTHQQWLCRRLADAGYDVLRQTTVSDTGKEIAAAVDEARKRAQIVITTGGLGPTSDDRTRSAIADLLGVGLEENREVLDRIRSFFQSRGKEMPASTALQAMVPTGATVLLNENGTAPGLAIEHSDRWLLMLPGPPRELHPMFVDQVMPWLAKLCPVEAPFSGLSLRVSGLGESRVQEMVEPGLADLVGKGLMVGYCARLGEVDIRLGARGADAKAWIKNAVELIEQTLGDVVFARGEISLEETVVRMLHERSLTLTLAESCTGGYISHRITNVPGSSLVLLGGYVTYSNDAKVRDLEVSELTIREHGAVSRQTAQEMAEGARRRTGADYAIAVTGIAGPSGGTKKKAVGTVYIALASHHGAKVVRALNPFERESFKFATSQQALDLLRRTLLKSAKE